MTPSGWSVSTVGEVSHPLFRRAPGALGLLMTLLATPSAAAPAHCNALPSAGPIVSDSFGRVLDEHGLVLVDWDGYLANPAIEFFITPPAAAVLPATATLSANGARLYFNLPCLTTPSGPSKTLYLPTLDPVSAYVSIFPDRPGGDEDYTLDIGIQDAAGSTWSVSLPVHVVDQDLGSTGAFALIPDYSKDDGGFFGPQQRAILQQAAADWAYFIGDMQLDQVPASAEWTWIWSWPLAFSLPSNGYYTVNMQAYTGFRLYAYGIDTPLLRSGGEPSTCCFQTSNGVPLPLRRSGGTEIEVKGNYNLLGWYLMTGDDDWLASGNLSFEPNDLYSIAHHEIGHALAFNSGYPNFAAGEGSGAFATSAILDYQGSAVPVSASFDHFDGVVDRLSRRGIFGNEYHGDMPAKRWLITKLDLLLLEAMGYALRPTSSLLPVSIDATALADGDVGVAYSDAMVVTGGVPFYNWVLDSGQLPPGLALDAFTGTISGTPTANGTFSFTLRVFDYDNGPGITASSSITIGDAWSDLGHALAGSNGLPSLTGQGSLVGGSLVKLQLDAARPKSPVAIVIGLTTLYAPFKGGVMVPDADLLVSGLLTTPVGSLSLAATWPAGLPSGFSFYTQIWIVDPAAIKGLAASNAISGTTP